MPGYFFKYVAPKIAKNLAERRKTQDEVFKSIDEKGKGLSLQKRSNIKKSFSEKASKLYDKASQTRKGKMGGGMMGRRMGYSQGKLAVTPREKQLAAQYGDKKRITRGDVITAARRLPQEEPMRDRMKQPLKRKKP